VYTVVEPGFAAVGFTLIEYSSSSRSSAILGQPSLARPGQSQGSGGGFFCINNTANWLWRGNFMRTTIMAGSPTTWEAAEAGRLATRTNQIGE